MKRCADCGFDRPLEVFGRNRSTHDGLTSYCQMHHRARNRASLARAGGSKHYHLKRRYGITLREFTAMREAQDGVCAICRTRPATDTDHDHETGKVRGLLCNPCNAGLGQLGDNVETMKAAIAYLEDHK